MRLNVYLGFKMDNQELRDLYQELIIDHGTQPRNCVCLQDANGEAEGFNPLCGDKVHLYLSIKNEIIEKATFTGSGCAISIASASLMTESLPGKSTLQALTLSHSFKILLTNDKNSEENSEDFALLGKLKAFAGVKTFPARVKCATLAWHTLQAAIQNEVKTVSTEIIHE